MRFAIGYQLESALGESMAQIVQDYREHIAEVYFPWVGTRSGRAALGVQRGYVDWQAQHCLEEDLQHLRAMGVKLDLLFNANSYGARAVSTHLQGEVLSILDHLARVVDGVDTVTTASPFIAHVVQEYFPEVEVRASVNMRLGTCEAMAYLADLFDSFYIQRDVQRNLAHVRRVKAWCDAHGKGLFLLANSGCLRHCPGQTFHDNMVAHDAEIDEQKNVPGWTPHVCWRLFADKANWPALLKSTWIRPEDLHHYDELFPVVKLATRMHTHPRLVIDAYTQRAYDGNLLDLFEPGFGPALAPRILDNTRFPADWFSRTSTCGNACQSCTFCTEVLGQVLRHAQAQPLQPSNAHAGAGAP